MALFVLGLVAPARAESTGPAPKLTRAPELLEGAAPEYPQRALASGIEGEVHLQLTLDAHGSVERVDVVQGVSPELDWAALGAATRLLFSPAEIDGKPAAVRVDYRIGFTLPVPDEEGSAPAALHPERSSGLAADATGTSASVTGRVRIAGTVRPLVGAEVALVFNDGAREGEVARVAVTDEDGRFRVAAVASGYYIVEVTAPGHELARSFEHLEPSEEVDLSIYLVPDVGDAFETTIRARRNRAAVSRVSLSRDEVRAIPGTFGDALRVVESLPGTARAPFLGGALIVRGGAPGDSAIFFDGIEIPVLYHWGGLASVVNSAFLEELSFYPGAFGVEYGGATAAAVDVRSHDLDFDAFQGSVEVDSLDTGFFFGGPIRLQGLPEVSFAFAARKSYLEGMGSLMLQLATLFSAPIPFLPVPSYSDFQLKVATRPLPGHRLSLFAFGADDRFLILGDAPAIIDDLDFGEVLNRLVSNHFFRAALEWEAQLLPGVTHLIRPYVGTTKRGILSDSIVVQAFTGASLTPPAERLDWGVRDELRLRFSPWLQLLTGVEHTGSTIGVSLGEPFAVPSEQCPPDMQDMGYCIVEYDLGGALLSVAAYAQAEIGPIGGLTVFPGVRVEHIRAPYQDHLGTVLGDKDEQGLAMGATVDPRLSLRWQASADFALKSGFGVYRSAPRTEEWLLDNDGRTLDLPRALHAVAGFEHRFSEHLELDVQVYGVRRDLLVEDGARAYRPEGAGGFGAAAIISQPRAFTNGGHGETLGLELLLRHRPSRHFFGWVAYTFQRTWLDLGEQRDPNALAPFDQTHNLILVGRVNLPWQLTLGGRLQIVSGNPSPVPAALAVIHELEHDGYQPLFSTLRPPRMPTYHRLDARIDRKWTFEGFAFTTYLEVVNVYNQLNAEVVVPGGDFRSRGTLVLLPSVPLLPSLGFSGSF